MPAAGVAIAKSAESFQVEEAKEEGGSCLDSQNWIDLISGICQGNLLNNY